MQEAPPNPWLRVFLPFALGYFLSYFLRTVNAVISPDLTAELALDDDALGLLTAAYFLAFALAQIPLGIALDRFGPRVIEGGLLLVTAAGTVLFALGESASTLGIARAMIGLGVSACLMASLKGLAMWYPLERRGAMTANIMAAGAIGALISSAPVEAMLPFLGWRGVFWVITAMAVGVAVYLLISLPRTATPGAKESLGDSLREVVKVFRSRGFWRYAPSAFFMTGGFMALQSLWTMAWLLEVNGLEAPKAAGVLFALNLGMLAGQLFIGTFGTRAARAGFGPPSWLRVGFGLTLAAEVVIVLGFGHSGMGPALLWFTVGLAMAVNGQGYLAAAEYFPVASFSRVSTAINLLAFIGAFAVQWGIGVLLTLLQAAGSTRASALKVAVVCLIVAQIASVIPVYAGSRARPAVQ